MVEKVAKAIYAEWAREAGKTESWDDLVCLGHSYAELARREARAAIEAMREPTKAMDDVGRDHNYSRYATAAWQAMIDEALSEEVAR